jgi:hypothetical protein
MPHLHTESPQTRGQRCSLVCYIRSAQIPCAQVCLSGIRSQTIQDLNLAEQEQVVKRHDSTPAPPIKDRPRKGHIGFQELSRGDDHVQIRYARIKMLD